MACCTTETNLDLMSMVVGMGSLCLSSRGLDLGQSDKTNSRRWSFCVGRVWHLGSCGGNEVVALGTGNTKGMVVGEEEKIVFPHTWLSTLL